MKKLFPVALLLSLSLTVFAKQVDEATAQVIARNFLARHLPAGASKGSLQLSTSYTAVYNSGHNYFYIFNVSNSAGFIIVSSEDAVTPVLSYSTEGNFIPGNIPEPVAKWLEAYKAHLAEIIEKDIPPTDAIAKQWQELKEGTSPEPASRSTNSVLPLIQTKWNQNNGSSDYYNAACPYDAHAGRYAVTGCVATAMAQIMKFWNYPQQGTDFHSYNSQKYGTLSANFAATTYNWGTMPNEVSGPNNEVATLMYHCGVSVDMTYSARSSGAWVIAADNPVCAQNAYTKYFGYNPATVQGLQRSNFSDDEWMEKLKFELDNGRPVQYAGFGSGGGHSWVCDGYDDNDYFHMNWGWGGVANGYFWVDELSPSILGTGGGSGQYNSNQQIVVGIQPLTGTTAAISMYSGITVTPNPIPFLSSITVKADLTNTGSSNFSGEYCAAIFTASGDFVDYIQVLATSNPLLPTYHYDGGLTFSNNKLLLVPGNYIIGIYFRPVGGSWQIAGNTSYPNYISVTVQQPTGSIRLYSGLSASPSTLIKDQPATISVDLQNTGSSTYYGEYSIALIDMDNNILQTIDAYQETSGLQAGYHYSSPVSFSTAAITAAPGTYLLAVLYKENGQTLYYAGGDLHSNPVMIDVVAPELVPDIYESNNSLAQSYLLPLSFSGSSINLNTQGSNCHTGSDFDYYMMDLPANYNYTINARLNDAYSSVSGNYTLDALVSYSTNGNDWSNPYDDVIPTIRMDGNRSLYFSVAPYFGGQTGTYRLDMSIARTQGLGVENAEPASPFSLFPNPVARQLIISGNGETAEFALYDISGQQVTVRLLNLKTNTIDVSSLAEGIYMVQMKQQGQTYSTKLSIVH